MAERRMFAKSIIGSDNFLDMPATTQLLYFHLAMRADDDGFINNAKTIMRMCGCKEDDLKLLIIKNYVIPFETGIVVITHWNVHNYIPKDRYKATRCTKEREQLAYDEKDKVYTKCIQPVYKVDTECIQAVSEMDTQDRLGKERIGKERIEVDKGKIGSILSLYQSICTSYPPLSKLTDNTEKEISKSLQQYTLDDFKQVFQKAEASKFLKGENERGWKAMFGWLIQTENIAKVLAGSYDNSPTKKQSKNRFLNYSQRDTDYSQYEYFNDYDSEENPPEGGNA